MQSIFAKFFILLYISFFYISCGDDRDFEYRGKEEKKQVDSTPVPKDVIQTETTQPEEPKEDVVVEEPEPPIQTRPEPEPYIRQRPEPQAPREIPPPRAEPEVEPEPEPEPEEEDPIASYVSSDNLKFVFFEGGGKKGFGLYQEIMNGYRQGDKALWLMHLDISDLSTWMKSTWVDNFSDNIKAVIQKIDQGLKEPAVLEKRICSASGNFARFLRIMEDVLNVGKLVFLKPNGSVEMYGKESRSMPKYFTNLQSGFHYFEITFAREVSGKLYVKLENLEGTYARIDLQSVKGFFDYEELSKEGKINIKDFSLEWYIHLLDSIYMQGTFSNCG